MINSNVVQEVRHNTDVTDRQMYCINLPPLTLLMVQNISEPTQDKMNNYHNYLLHLTLEYKHQHNILSLISLLN